MDLAFQRWQFPHAGDMPGSRAAEQVAGCCGAEEVLFSMYFSFQSKPQGFHRWESPRDKVGDKVANGSRGVTWNTP